MLEVLEALKVQIYRFGARKRPDQIPRKEPSTHKSHPTSQMPELAETSRERQKGLHSLRSQRGAGFRAPPLGCRVCRA